MIKKLFFFLTVNYLLFAIVVSPVLAQCPVCAIAVTAGLGLSRWLGIDDAISGLWVGAMLVSLSLWTINWLSKKKIRFLGRQPLVFAAYYLMTFGPLFWGKIIGHPANQLWGLDKLVLGTIIGSLFFLAGYIGYNYLKAKNGGHAHFPFQKVVMPVGPIVILSIIFYLITK